MQMQMAGDTWRPLSIQFTGSGGASQHMRIDTIGRRIVKVEIPGQSSLAWPQVSAVLEMKGGVEGSSARFAFDRMSSDVSEQPMNRVFDLDSLRAALRPEVEGRILGGDADRDHSPR